MIRKKSKLQLAQDEAQAAIDKTNQKYLSLESIPVPCMQH